ncbi:uncharacterized protein OD91_2393 [Lutibacter sp. Hel_I_33_5]|uniref:DUF418 domain-containing protein n=1 Tax=Lutibacter sp. Hel_I_33_5 TaxID=1566289 RepID=UPI0011A94D10|nr:DUF418 domain-containing protein [Lutibacter sp. Hel_I_33_5]TVZ57087.1 uncharacterized protein OD91_2393 [Lutibacter sp. Hel_I_33_5]
MNIKDTIRLHNVDALRGLAIISIMLLHNLEHFDVYHLPKNLPIWMVQFDKIIWDGLFFLFAGKSYAIFALLFGLTFQIQYDNQEKKGSSFNSIFAWRLILLFGFGIINSAFFQGDILTLYAVFGFCLIPFSRVSNKLVFAVIIVLLLQPLEVLNLVQAIKNPNAVVSNPESWAYFGKMNEYIKGDSFINTVYGNLTNGKIGVLRWSYENGRFFYIPALFLLGMLGGRKKVFSLTTKNKIFWKKALIISSILFVPLFIFQKNIDTFIESKAIQQPVKVIESAWTNLVFMIVIVSGFTLLFHNKVFKKILNVLSPIGKMSLTCYIMQSVSGSIIYYGFGLGFYQFTGATYSLLIGLFLSVLMWSFSSWWMKHHRRGPLEALWHKVTWMFK